METEELRVMFRFLTKPMNKQVWVTFVKVEKIEGKAGWYEAVQLHKDCMARISFPQNSCSAELGHQFP